MRLRLVVLSALIAGLATSACAAANRVTAGEAKPTSCPADLKAPSRCFAGEDANGAFYWIVIPEKWNGSLVVHTHGGPSMKAPKADDPLSDLRRFSVTVDEGFAWAGSSYRHAGFGVRDAAADTDALRALFWKQFGRPKHTLLHGQSWGANVAEKTAELYGRDARGGRVYDGVVLTSGVLGGGTRSYDFRADLRAVYQFYCQNLPAPGEATYPLWQGLGAGDRFSKERIDKRVDACTGVDHKPAERTPEQARNLADILSVIHIPERTLASHMDWSTLTFRDLVLRQLKGANPFSNTGVVYKGSHDDAALNAGVERFAATQGGVDALSYDADLTGRLAVPTLTMHATDDPTAFVELERVFHDTVAGTGRSDLLVQVFTDEHEHSKLATPQYAALFRGVVAWIERGEKPTVASVAAECERARATYGEACHFVPDYQPPPLETRVYARKKPAPRPAP